MFKKTAGAAEASKGLRRTYVYVEVLSDTTTKLEVFLIILLVEKPE